MLQFTRKCEKPQTISSVNDNVYAALEVIRNVFRDVITAEFTLPVDSSFTEGARLKVIAGVVAERG